MEFQKFIRTFNRMDNMCIMTDKPNPFEEITSSSYMEDWLTWICDNPAAAEKIIEDWLKEHPEPIYPTFFEVIQDMISENPELRDVKISDLMHYRVPDNAAERWGITPINEGGLEKYVKEWV